MGDEPVLAGEEFGGQFGMLERIASVCRGAGVLHAAGDEVIDHGLRVLFPWVIDAEFFAEEFDHLRSAGVVDGETVAAAFGGVVGDGDAAPGIFYFFEFTGDNREEIRGARYGFFPGPRLHTVASVG